MSDLEKLKQVGVCMCFKYFKSHRSRVYKNHKVNGEGDFKSYFEMGTLSNESKFCVLMDLTV